MTNELMLESILDNVYGNLEKRADVFTEYPMNVNSSYIVKDKKYFLTNGSNFGDYKISGKIVPKYEVVLSDNLIRGNHYFRGRCCSIAILNSNFDGANCNENEIEIYCKLSPKDVVDSSGNKYVSIIMKEDASPNDIANSVINIMENFDTIYTEAQA